MPAQNWIRAALKERGFKLKDAAAALNITPPRMTDILKGMREVQSDEVLPLSKLLGMSTMSLLSSLTAGERQVVGVDIEGPSLSVSGQLTGVGNVLPLDTDEKIVAVPVPPDADAPDGLYCYIMGDDSLEQEIRKGSLVIAGDPRVHFNPIVPGAILLVDLGGGRVTARQYFRADNGEDWLVPLPRNHNPLYESWRFSMLPQALDKSATASPDNPAPEIAGQHIIRTDDIVAVVMWVHRRFTPPTA